MTLGGATDGPAQARRSMPVVTGPRRRERHGRGIRGPLAWPPVPAMETRRARFDALGARRRRPGASAPRHALRRARVRRRGGAAAGPGAVGGADRSARPAAARRRPPGRTGSSSTGGRSRPGRRTTWTSPTSSERWSPSRSPHCSGCRRTRSTRASTPTPDVEARGSARGSSASGKGEGAADRGGHGALLEGHRGQHPGGARCRSTRAPCRAAPRCRGDRGPRRTSRRRGARWRPGRRAGRACGCAGCRR